VILAARRESEGHQAAARLAGGPGEALAWPLDVGSPPSVAAFAERVRREGSRIDALVENAGVYLSGTDADAFRESMAVNVLGPVALLDALEPLLARSARVVMVSSGMGQLAGLPADLRRKVEAIRDRVALRALAEELVGHAATSGGGAYLAYSASKALLNAATRFLAAELGPRHVLVNSVCPGWVRTDMGGAGAPRSVEEGARGIVWAATLPPDGPSGGFFRDGRLIAW
jgi:NAD(P)-dependent dehydrogenase (short-subunit alcohol dehydrogenase family)